jgi:hypothetical protein
MTDDELNQKLKAAQTPKFEPDYIEDFPRLVFARNRAPAPQRREPYGFSPRLAWGAGIALTCLVLGFASGFLSPWHGRKPGVLAMDVLANAKMIRETMALFPNQVRAIVQDDRGLKLVLADQPDVPSSPPLYIQICDGKECSSLVTFSGEEIQVGQRKITVLADARGGIILEGDHFVWSSNERSASGRLKIQARTLTQAAL